MTYSRASTLVEPGYYRYSVAMRIALCMLGLAGLVLTAPLGAETIYKWVDPDGQPHFSDVPREGAEEVYVASPQSYSPTRIESSAGKTATNGDDKPDEAAGDRYTTFTITSPTEEETIWNTGGKISVSLNLRPALASGHTIRLLLDGRQKQQLGQGVRQTQLSGIPRGEHQIQAQVVTPDRQVVTTSQVVTFFYKQTQAARNPAAGQPPATLPTP